MLVNLASIATTVLLLGSVISAAPGNPGQIVQIKSGTNWCMMMPPEEGGDIAASEDFAIAFCTNEDVDAPGAKIFPPGFIQSANFASGKGYVQVTGKIDRTKYSLAETDQGGQYDIKAPVGSACAGYNHYVNLIEPHSNTYCIRCCDEKMDCNIGKSTFGCAYIIPGDYSGPSDPDVPKVSAPVTSTTGPSSVVSPTAITTAVTHASSSVSPASTTVTTTTVSASSSQGTNAAVAQSYSAPMLGVAAVAAAVILL